MLEKVWGKVRGCMGFVGFAAAFAVALLGDVAMAADSAIPALPVDFAALASDGVTIIGTVFAAIAGVIILFAICRAGFRLVSNAFQGRV